jgi:tRNA modification GTPase
MAQDTIVAIATAQGRGAIGVVRASGPGVGLLMQHLCGRELDPRRATHLSFLDIQGQPIDEGLALYFPAPHSYTGEDILELQGHGGVGVLQLLLRRCLEVGEQIALSNNLENPSCVASVIRLAQAGEFTRRAFLNDKLDLVQAEAVADLIEASSERAARSALASLQGAFSREVSALVAALVDLRMRVEACLDFPEEDIEFIVAEHVAQKLQVLQERLQQALLSANRGAVLREGLTVVLVGAPNVGKSSLLNALAEEEVALVTDIAGTTRDRIRQEIHLAGVPIHVIDTAGLRPTSDRVEQLGIELTWREIATAQVVLLLSDASQAIFSDQQLEQQVLSKAASDAVVIRLLNKADLVGHAHAVPSPGGSALTPERAPAAQQERLITLSVSAKTGLGLEVLKQQLLSIAGWSGDASASVFSARTRHLQALTSAGAYLTQASRHLEQAALELLAENLRLAQQELATITGAFTAEDLLGEIFGRFCIGK